MHTPSKLAAMLLGLALFSGGAMGASAHGPLFTTGVAHSSAITRQAPVTAQQAAPGQDPRCSADQANDPAEGDVGAAQESSTDTDNVQDQNGAKDAKENPTDTDNLQCGDQQGQDAGTNTAVHGPRANAVSQSSKLIFLRTPLMQATATAQAASGEQESTTEVETGIDQETDGVVCEQQGEHAGENTGC